jgi:hypothetical protein
VVFTRIYGLRFAAMLIAPLTKCEAIVPAKPPLLYRRRGAKRIRLRNQPNKLSTTIYGSLCLTNSIKISVKTLEFVILSVNVSGYELALEDDV